MVYTGTWLDIWRVQFYLCEMGTVKLTLLRARPAGVCAWSKLFNLLWESIVNTAKKKKRIFYIIFILNMIYKIKLMLTQIYQLSYSPLLSTRKTRDWILGPWANYFKDNFLYCEEDLPSWVCTGTTWALAWKLLHKMAYIYKCRLFD